MEITPPPTTEEPRDHAWFADLAELAPLQLLEPDEHRKLTDHLARGCDVCAERYRLGVEALEVLASSGPRVQPSPAARDALLDAIDALESRGAARRAATRPRVERWGAPLAAMAASIAMLAAIGSVLVSQRHERAAQRAVELAAAQVERQFSEQDRRFEALSQRLAAYEAVAATDRGVRVRELTLEGEEAFLSASARVVMDAAGQQVLLFASRLPAAPPAHTYQLWVIISGTPRSLGVFRPDEEGRVLHVESERIDLASDAVVAVSVEPDGGVPRPTGPIVLVSH